ncbi:MAG: transcription termination/antitermination protein NusA [Dehalococcoidia bacterium]|nr:transcription termination/antitermination protein NusA [Dehalococcoidia bacterium]
MKSDFLLAVTQLATERRLPRDVVLGAIEDAVRSAYKRDGTETDDIEVQILPTTGEIIVTLNKAVVETVNQPAEEITLEDARLIKPGAQIGDVISVEESPEDAGRIAAQTAKQVVMQRLREAERDQVYDEYAGRINELMTGVVQKVEQGQVIVGLGRTEATLLHTEQVPSEQYYPRQRIRVLIQEVEKGIRGPRILVSRAHRDLIRRLFELEVPEIMSGTVVIRNVAREPGYRSKVAVEARQEGVDPVGSCVGLRGVRIQNIVNELHGEKIDVIPWNEDPSVYIGHALSPAQTSRVEITGDRSALVVVPEQQLSLAIGREGLNARLAARLTGWRIDIRSTSEVLAEEAERAARGPEQAAVAEQSVETEEPEVDAVVAEAVSVAEEAEAEAAAEAAPVEETLAAATTVESAETDENEVEAAEELEAVATAEVSPTDEAQTTEAAAPEASQTEEDIEEELRKLQEEEEALLRALEEAEAESDEDDEDEEADESDEESASFDFDAFLQEYQSERQGETSGGIRFAEDIFPERGGRFRGGRDERRGGRRGGNR